MFKNITINLTESICDCESREVEWALTHTELHIICKICDTRLSTKITNLKANFNYDRPGESPAAL